MKETIIESEYIKLGQFLKYEGLVDTGGEAKNIIKEGLVKVNGIVETARGKKLYKGDVIEVFGKTIRII